MVHRTFFLFVILGLTISLTIKAIFNGTESIFYQAKTSEVNKGYFLEQEVQSEFVLKYIAITFSFAVSELGFIFMWMVMRKPLEFYSKLNANLWSTEQ